MNYRIAYLGETMVNWCPQLGTVLANDEVVDGVSERGGFPVVQKKMRQWCLRVSAYAQRLLDGLGRGIDGNRTCAQLKAQAAQAREIGQGMADFALFRRAVHGRDTKNRYTFWNRFWRGHHGGRWPRSAGGSTPTGVAGMGFFGMQGTHEGSRNGFEAIGAFKTL